MMKRERDSGVVESKESKIEGDLERDGERIREVESCKERDEEKERDE